MTTAVSNQDTRNTRPSETIARRYYALVDAREIDALVDLFHESVIYERQGTPAIEGRAALRRFYESERAIAGGRHHLDQVLGDGDWVAVRGRFEGELLSGERVTLRFTDWLLFRDGRIVRRETLFPGRQV